MKVRQLHRIMNLPQAQRFPLMADGLRLLAGRVRTLDEDSLQLNQQGRRRSSEILGGFADEEAAKVMVLLDIARAGWSDPLSLRNAFHAFRDHLARGLYVEAYDGRPATLGEVRRFVDQLRQSLYLDGPNEVDWVFRNEVLERRESRLYVDLVAEEEDKLRWTSPADRDIYDYDGESHRSSWIVQLTMVMDRLGLLTEAGFTATAAAWDSVEINDDTHWATVERLNREVLAGLDKRQPASSRTQWTIADTRYLVDHWIFPLTGLDLTQREISRAKLRERREAWISQQL